MGGCCLVPFWTFLSSCCNINSLGQGKSIPAKKTTSSLPFHDYDPSNFSLTCLSNCLVEMHKELVDVMSTAMTNTLNFRTSIAIASANDSEQAAEEVQALIEPTNHVTKPSARQMCLSSTWKV